MSRDITACQDQFGDGNAAITVHVARPLGEGPFSGLMVFHEAFELNDDIRRTGDRFAMNGYVTVAPDLIGGGFSYLVRVSRDLSRGDGPVFDKAALRISSRCGGAKQ